MNRIILIGILSLFCGNIFAQNYFPLMSKQAEDKLYKINIPYDEAISKEQITLLLDTAFNNKIDSFCNKWYSKHLKTMEEPIIYSDKTNKEIIRFTWLRTFHEPIAIRIENNNGICFIYWKKTNGQGGYEVGNLIVDKKKQINIQQWNDIVKKLNESKFWKMPTNVPILGNDGAQWILEAKIGEKYYVVDRWSGKNSEIGQFCLYLLKMTNLKIEKNKIY